MKTFQHIKIATWLVLSYSACLLVVAVVLLRISDSGNARMTLLLTGCLMVASIFGAWAVTRWILTRPLAEILETGRRLRKGDLTARANLKLGGELQQVGDTLDWLTSELVLALNRQEITVAERTMILQRRAKQLQAAAEVGKAAVTFRNLDVLLPEVTRLISARFDLYHVGIFLLDANDEYAVLRASNSEGGKQLLASGHKLKVGVQGMVGNAAMSGEPRIALDVGQDAVHFKNPALPDTRSEMALPLMIGGKILGVLDVQSARAGAFTEEDASILQIMADQIAIAIDNAHLLAETSAALESSRRAFGELQQEVWNKVLSGKPEVGYLATREDEQAKENSLPADASITVAIQSGEIAQTDASTVAIPIKLRDVVIGAVRLQKSKNERGWTPEEIKLMQTIADQLSIALESARLYADTQRRAERERLAGEISGKIRASNDPNEILQVAARELRHALRASQAQVLIQGTNGEGRTAAIAGEQKDQIGTSPRQAS